VRILADENMHRIVVVRLRAAGFDVEWIRESHPGLLDRDILRRPDIAGLILVTHDRDFGDLIFNQGLPAPQAVLYSRLPHRASEETARRLIGLLEAGGVAGQMITITKDGYRTRPFPLGGLNG
jgi:predicted nuclease of predicted toxin-antitoxin system